jgi:hypothetical protein
MTLEERLRNAKTNPAPYEERYVALVDVLGWSDIVERSVVDPGALSPVSEGAEIISMAREWAEETNQIGHSLGEDTTFEMDIRVSHFSDTFVFSLPIGHTAVVVLRSMLGQLCVRLLECEHYTRGAIVRGLVRHTQSVLYGPAIIHAHHLESRVAKYPRIVVSPEAEQAFEGDDHSLRTDFDGLKYLDILRPYRPTLKDLEWLEGLHTLATRRAELDRANLERVAKHRWFASYVAETLERARGEVAGYP